MSQRLYQGRWVAKTKGEITDLTGSRGPLRVLLLEDNPHDVKLTVAALKREGYLATFDTTDSPEVFRRELEQTDYDIILADYNLGTWTAMDALETLHQSGKDIPFVVVSGSLGDEAAVECIKKGATDFVLKDRPARLPSAICRALAEKAMREENNRANEATRQLAAIVESSHDAIIGEDLDGTILSWNKGAERIFGYSAEEVKGKAIDVLVPPDRGYELPQIMEKVKRGEKITDLETVRASKDGQQIDVSLTISPLKDAAGRAIAASVIARDITEYKRLEEQLRQAHKMEAVGRLAGGIAHDFNNLLTIITGYSQLLLDRPELGPPTREHVDNIKKAGDRAAALTRQLLAFSRKQVLAPQVLDLNSVVANIEKMLQRLIGEDIELLTVLAPDLGRVKADPGQIEQVLLNLAANARDAMPQGGKLTFETANVNLDETYPRRHVPVVPGPYVMLAVSDTGCGMDAEIQAHIFEPFFTTKEVGKGTGLGLATVFGIVKQSGGYIWVYSEPGHGTTFKIYLHSVEEAVRSPGGPVTPARRLEGSETILLVEDEPRVRSLARVVLEARGYRVLEAGWSHEALEISQRYEGPIHLLVTDLVMPHMTGQDLAARLKTVNPELKVLYISGHAEKAIVHHGVLNEGTAFIGKPFAPDALVLKVREVLDGESGI